MAVVRGTRQSVTKQGNQQDIEVPLDRPLDLDKVAGLVEVRLHTGVAGPLLNAMKKQGSWPSEQVPKRRRDLPADSERDAPRWLFIAAPS